MLKTEFTKKYLIPAKKTLTRLEQKGFINLKNEDKPFAIVFMPQIILPQKLIRMIMINERTAGTEKTFKFNEIKNYNGTLIPGKCYLILNIKTHLLSKEISPYKAAENLFKEKRSPLTIWEGISTLVNFPDEIIKNGKDLIIFNGSRYLLNWVPALKIKESKFTSVRFNNTVNSDWIAMSCDAHVAIDI